MLAVRPQGFAACCQDRDPRRRWMMLSARAAASSMVASQLSSTTSIPGHEEIRMLAVGSMAEGSVPGPPPVHLRSVNANVQAQVHEADPVCEGVRLALRDGQAEGRLADATGP